MRANYVAYWRALTAARLEAQRKTSLTFTLTKFKKHAYGIQVLRRLTAVLGAIAVGVCKQKTIDAWARNAFVERVLRCARVHYAGVPADEAFAAWKAGTAVLARTRAYFNTWYAQSAGSIVLKHMVADWGAGRARAEAALAEANPDAVFSRNFRSLARHFRAWRTVARGDGRLQKAREHRRVTILRSVVAALRAAHARAARALAAAIELRAQQLERERAACFSAWKRLAALRRAAMDTLTARCVYFYCFVCYPFVFAHSSSSILLFGHRTASRRTGACASLCSDAGIALFSTSRTSAMRRRRPKGARARRARRPKLRARARARKPLRGARQGGALWKRAAHRARSRALRALPRRLRRSRCRRRRRRRAAARRAASPRSRCATVHACTRAPPAALAPPQRRRRQQRRRAPRRRWRCGAVSASRRRRRDFPQQPMRRRLRTALRVLHVTNRTPRRRTALPGSHSPATDRTPQRRVRRL